jgi:GNAT superfamily N-acetyltransferase
MDDRLKNPLGDGYHDVPAGKIAAVVTHLEMPEPPSHELPPARPDVDVVRVGRPSADWYRDLYARIGTDWLWTSRLQMAGAKLAAIIHDHDVEVCALRRAGAAIGLLELDFRVAGECELVFFGVIPAEIGRGLGRFLMAHAIARAWSRPIRRFWLHTCTLDHPDALVFYIRSGFTPFRRQIEIADDPRVGGVLPRSAAPQVPIVGPGEKD